LLSDAHVVVLSLLLIAAPPIKNPFEFIGLHVVALGLVPFSHLVHDFKKGYNSLIWQEIYS
jgi:hypothetical protein